MLLFGFYYKLSTVPLNQSNPFNNFQFSANQISQATLHYPSKVFCVHQMERVSHLLIRVYFVSFFLVAAVAVTLTNVILRWSLASLVPIQYSRQPIETKTIRRDSECGAEREDQTFDRTKEAIINFPQ